MRLAHTALWTSQIEVIRDFYLKYFQGKSNEKYTNYQKKFSSYFISFGGDASLEIMQREDIREQHTPKEHIGLAHIAFGLNSEKEVNEKTELFRSEGYTIVSEPRLTGDGYYESAITDPDGNIVELVSLPEISIHKTTDYPYDLLLLADPDENMVNTYIHSSDCIIAVRNQQPLGVIVMQKQDGNGAEIMNLAVDESFQRQGIAWKLMQYVCNQWVKDNNIQKMKICTGTSAPGPLMLYQKMGFDIISFDYNYFIRSYPEPIWENGVQCKHRVIMERTFI